MLYRLLADATLILHLLFVLFVVLGGFWVMRWPRLAWIHLPAAVWGALIELTGWICPLTPLENRLRQSGGEAGYEGGFVDHYVFGLLYPDGLTREVQLLLAAVVFIVNIAVYAWVFHRRGGRQ